MSVRHRKQNKTNANEVENASKLHKTSGPQIQQQNQANIQPANKDRPKYYHFFDPVDNSTLIFFRIFWGIIMMYECWTYIREDYSKLENYYMRSEFYPKYYLFEWVEAWPGNGLYIQIWFQMLMSLGITFGCFYRLCSFFFVLSFSYFYLLDSCLYLNHFYLIILMALLLIFLPANADLSVDSLLFPSIRSSVMPRYILYLLRAEQTIVYFYAGVAKVNEDWLRGEPLRHWLFSRTYRGYFSDSSLSYYFSKFMASELGVYFISYSGLIFDMMVGFMLLFPRGIIFYSAILSSFVFHTLNKILFSIGIFPYVMLISTTLYFEPNWVRKLLPFIFRRNPTPIDLKPKSSPLSLREIIAIGLVILFLLHQIITPARGFLLSVGDPAWDETSHRYSWRMKLRDKVCDIKIAAQDPLTDKMFSIDFYSHLYGKQARKIKPRPDEVLQFVHYIGNKYKESTFQGRTPRVFVDLKCSLNYRPNQLMMKNDFDLMTVEPYDWARYPEFMIPLEPLRPQDYHGYPWNWNWSWEKIKEFLSDPLKPIKLSPVLN